MHNQFSESVSLFAIDVSTGKTLWEFKAENSIRHNSIAIGNDRIYLIDRPIARMDFLYRRGIEPRHETGVLVALDARTGKTMFRKNENIWGTLLILNEKYNKLIMSYSDTRYKLPSEKGGKIAAFNATTGVKIWESGTRQKLPANYSSTSYSRPLVNDTIIFVEPETFDLFTGEVIDNSFQRSYGCGIVSGSKKMLFFRSATVGYYWFDNIDAGTQNYGGIRPGCWINVIPSGGLVLMPDATNRCDCSYLIKSWIALKPSKSI
jgi:outer membrane protein assembly factor BamB